MSCATEPCEAVSGCALVGGCVQTRFPGQQPHEQRSMRRTLGEAEGLKASAPALNGTKGRAVRDPRFIKRDRKPLTYSR